MKSNNSGRITVCIVILLGLILGCFVRLHQPVTGNSTTIGSYANGNPIPPGVVVENEEIADPSWVGRVTEINAFLNSNVAWGIFTCMLLVFVGIFLSIRTGFPQIRHFKRSMKDVIDGAKTDRHAPESEHGSLSPFQALCTALAATVGTGNIVGVTSAIILGGPGAVFWMWVSAFFGMCIMYAEIVLAVKFRERTAEGEWVGGPMYYIRNGMGKGWGWLATLFAALGALACFGIGNLTQVNTIADAMVAALDSLTDFTVTGSAMESKVRLVVGFAVAIAAGLVILGGLHRLGKVTERLVPTMSILYIVGSLVVIFCNFGNLGMVFASIFRSAFTKEAAFGGVGGFVLMNVIKKGIGRGIFSNEAGLGSASIAHASTNVREPAVQGLYGIFEVFWDTIVICTMTALVVLSANVVPWGNTALSGTDTAIGAFAQVFGKRFSSIFVAVTLLCFAFSTILTWSLYGQRCFAYLTHGKFLVFYRVLFVLLIIAGAVMDFTLVWDIADTLNGFMAIPNLIALLSLSGTVVAETKHAFARKPSEN